jgi:two-component system, repressor protein LuxO
MRPRVLLVEDTPTEAELARAHLAAFGHECHHAGTVAQALDIAAAHPPDAVLIDLQLPDGSGFDLMRRLRQAGVDAAFIVITVNASVKAAVEAMREGAMDFIVKPYSRARLQVTLDNALETRRLRAELEAARAQLGRGSFFGFVGSSPAMQAVYRTIESVAGSKASVFITGESGTGKELAADAIHRASPRAGKPFVALNCAAIPRDLLESEIFGHVKGAFTGATDNRLGAAKQADGGTLFLDEVAEMEPDIQVKFLRALEQRSFRRLGGKKEVEVDIRVVAATNKNIEDALRDGKLRDDLYHRLAVIPMHLPPLRERGGDVQLLAEEFLRRFAKEQGKAVSALSEGAIEYISTYRWPGNVRELKNAIERAVILARGPTIEVSDLQPRHLAYDEAEVHIPVGTSLADSERQIMLKTFAFTSGDYRKTARILGVTQKLLKERLQKYVNEPVAAG